MVIDSDVYESIEKDIRAESTITIVILLGAPFTSQNYERIGIPYLSKHFEVIVFDCMKWLGRNSEGANSRQAVWSKIIPIGSRLDFDEQIKNYSPHYAIDFIGFGDFTLDICNTLEKYNVKFVIQKTGSLPPANIAMRLQKFIRRLFFRGEKISGPINSSNKNPIAKKMALSPISNLMALVNRKLGDVILVNKLNSLPNRIGLIAGNKSLDRFTRKCDPIIWIGSHDYHTYNRTKKELSLNATSEIGLPFILFIDDYLPGASDWIFLGMSPPVSAATYYPALNIFFEKIEAIFDMPVRIAAHPNGIDDKNYESKMGGRAVFHGDTAMLTLKSSLVLAHGSTAISFAVLDRKPTVFLTSQELDRSHFGLNVRAMSKSLGSPLFFIDDNENQMIDLKKIYVNEAKYKAYQEDFLNNVHSIELEPWGEFIRYVKNSF